MTENSQHTPRRIDRFVGEHRYLSNFFMSPVRDELGDVYPSVEHAYQATKATTEDDKNAILAAVKPMEAKEHGSKFVLASNWQTRKLEVMHLLLRNKFAPGTPLADKLLATGDAQIIEGNNWGDDFWGQCNGVGENHLGRLLMEIRAGLRAPSQVV